MPYATPHAQTASDPSVATGLLSLWPLPPSGQPTVHIPPRLKEPSQRHHLEEEEDCGRNLRHVQVHLESRACLVGMACLAHLLLYWGSMQVASLAAKIVALALLALVATSFVMARLFGEKDAWRSRAGCERHASLLRRLSNLINVASSVALVLPDLTFSAPSTGPFCGQHAWHFGSVLLLASVWSAVDGLGLLKRLFIEQVIFLICTLIYWGGGISVGQAAYVLALSVGSTLVSAPISTTTRLILIPSTDQEERDFDILGIISQELLPGNMPIAGAVYTSIIAYALTASQVVFPHQMLPNPPELASASKNLPCKYLLFFLTAHASIKLSKIAVFGRDARSKLSRKNVFPKRVVRYDGPVERLVSMGERLASMGERLASMGEQVTKESDLLDKLNGGESGNRRGGDGGCLPVPAEGGAREGDGVKSRQRRSSGSGTASPHTSSQHSPMVSLGNSSRGNSRSASAENLMFLIERDLARETRERELLKEVEKESELARGNLSSGGSESGRSLFGIASSATPSLSSQKSGLGRRLSNPRRKGKANKVLSPLTPAQVQQVLSTSSSIADMFLLDEMQAIDIKRREGNSTAMADGELESAGSLLDLTSQTMGGVEI